MVLDFSTCPEDYGGGWEEGEGWLPELLPLRAELISGDLRVLYLTWLLSAQCGEVDEAAQEPPLPPGLKNLSAAQECLIEFLRLDPELVAVAAELSEAQQELPYDIDPWIAALPEAEKNDLLIQLVKGQDPQLGARLLKRYRSSIKSVADVSPGRTASELLHATQERHEAREREENRCKAKARADYLDGLALREEAVWRQVEELVEMRQAKPYGSAVELLKDLRELDRNRDNISWFQRRLSDLCGRHNKKRGFIDRLKKAGLQ
jgi:hypothetical protein